jgi:hypothetical protein
MKLETLSRYDGASARALLASASLSVGSSEYKPLQDQGLRREILDLLAEVRQQLGINPEDNSPKAMNRLSARISEQLNAATFVNRSYNEVVERLGSRGALPISAYDVETPALVARRFKENSKYLSSAIKSADEVFHVPWDEYRDNNRDIGASLFLKRQKAKRGQSEHWLMIVTTRKGSTLEVLAPIRIFPEIVQLTEVADLIGMLRAFVDVYGVRFSIPALANNTLFIHNLIMDANFPRLPKITPDAVLSYEPEDGVYIEAGEQVLDENDGVIATRVSLAFALDLGKYLADKRKFSL